MPPSSIIAKYAPEPVVEPMSLKAMIYVQHLLGTGHAVRAAAIGRALAARGVETLLVTGNRLPPTLDTGGLRIAELPPVRAADTSFDRLVDVNGDVIDDAWRVNRSGQLVDVFTRYSPDILVTETFPFGRRKFVFEMLPLLEAAELKPRPPLIATSVRDILVRKDNPVKERWMAEFAQIHYDVVLVHADPAFVRLDDSFPYADRISDIIRYTGYVHQRRDTSPPDGDGDDEVIVSCGGGAVGHELLDAALEARALSHRAGDARWRLLVGHDHDDTTLARLTGQAPAGIVVERARPDFPALLERARLSISQAGYNTVIDLLTADCPAVYVPFRADGETEQTQRAKLLAQRGLAVVVEESALTPAALAMAADAALELSPAPLPVRLNGAGDSAEVLIEEERRRRR